MSEAKIDRDLPPPAGLTGATLDDLPPEFFRFRPASSEKNRRNTAANRRWTRIRGTTTSVLAIAIGCCNRRFGGGASTIWAPPLSKNTG